MKRNEWWKKIPSELFVSFLILIIFLLSFDLFQYLTTEFWWIQDSVNYNHTTIFLLFLIFLFSFLPIKKWLNKNTKLRCLITVLFFLTLLGHQKYTNFYKELQQHPKIKSISKDWGVPWSWVKISGKNFGEKWEPVMVYLGETETIIKKWTPKEIVFEITAEATLGEQRLRVVNSKDNEQLKELIFEVKPHVN